MKKMRSVILLIAVVLLLVSGVALAQSDSPPLPAKYAVRQGVIFGGEYRLISTRWQTSGVASGGAYRLTGLVVPNGTGTPCCCTYLPCALRNH